MTKPKSGRFPWFKFNPRRWLSDTELRVCSPAARGVWADMLCVIHEADSGGYLLIAGEKPKPVDMAKIVGVSVREYLRLENELERFKVFSRRPDGVIYCRKTVRESAPAEPPSGCPKGDPSGILISPEGSPPSRALSPLSSLSSSPGGSPEGGSRLRAVAGSGLSREAMEQLGMHEYLDCPDVAAAMARWEAHLSEKNLDPWRGQTWASNLSTWDRWGDTRVARVVAAIAYSIGRNWKSIYEDDDAATGAGETLEEQLTRQYGKPKIGGRP